MRHVVLVSLGAIALVACGGDGSQSTGGDAGAGGGGGGGGGVGGGGGSVGGAPGCTVFPADNPWNQDISGVAVDPMSDAYMAHMNGSTKKVHPDFGSDPSYGIPYIVVPGTEPKLDVTFDYKDESDPGPYPIPLDAPIEGGPPNGDGDKHVLAIDKDNCVLYELFDATRGSGAWTAGSGAVFDLKSNKLRSDGFTSADAAGLPIFPGLVRYDEAMSGEIKHALRFTVQKTQNAYIHPATHAASSDTSADAPPMGLRVRMKASFDTSKFTGASLAVVNAMKKYGMFVADNGSDWYVSGESNPKWNDDDLSQLKAIPASAYEVVKSGTIQVMPP